MILLRLHPLFHCALKEGLKQIFKTHSCGSITNAVVQLWQASCLWLVCNIIWLVNTPTTGCTFSTLWTERILYSPVLCSVYFVHVAGYVELIFEGLVTQGARVVSSVYQYVLFQLRCSGCSCHALLFFSQFELSVNKCSKGNDIPLTAALNIQFWVNIQRFYKLICISTFFTQSSISPRCV